MNDPVVTALMYFATLAMLATAAVFVIYGGTQ